MSSSERDWMSPEFDRSQKERPKLPWTITKCLIVLNVAIFVLGMLWTQPLQSNSGLPYGGNVSVPFLYGFYSEFTCWHLGEYWRLVTYQFLHANLGHLAFNMVALYFFGGLVEKIMGEKRYILFYLICGISGALFSTLLGSLGLYDGGPAMDGYRLVPMVGASGSIYGILVAGAFIFPKIKVQLLFPPVTLTMRTLAWALVGLSVVIIGFDLRNAGGEAGHMGGMIMGLLLIMIPYFRGKGARKIMISTQEEIDRILDKIHVEGQDSLTENEREFIERIARESRGR